MKTRSIGLALVLVLATTAAFFEAYPLGRLWLLSRIPLGQATGSLEDMDFAIGTVGGVGGTIFMEAWV